MKKLFVAFIVSLFFVSCIQAQTPGAEKAVKTTIMKFAKSADKQDADALDKILDDNFRIVMNQLFGSTEAVVMNKTAYLGKIRTKEFGGDKRQVKIENLDINDKTATAKVTFRGSKLTLATYLLLIKTHSGNWKVVSDLPTVL